LLLTTKVGAIAFLLFTVAMLGRGEAYAQIAVVVNSENPIDTLSTVELRSIYLFETEAWEFDGNVEVKITVMDYSRKMVALKSLALSRY